MAAPQQLTKGRTYPPAANTVRGSAGPAGIARRLRPSQVPIAIGRADDASERQAEATADAMSQPGTASLPEPLQRGAGHPTLARMPGDGLLRDEGEALDHGVRRIMEPRLGFDLGGVRVHRGDAGARATTALNARAFTAGRDIAFAPGEFRPGTASGRRLLAHELTHVAQQAHAGAPAVQRQPKPGAEPWQTQIDDILARNVGLLEHMNRIMQLTDRFNTSELNELIGLIHANPGATKFTRDEYGVPGIFALQDTRIGNRLDVAAARFLLERFPAHPATPRKSEEEKADVFSEQVVREAYLRFHYNAILRGDKEPVAPDLPNKIRQDCIAIVHALVPQLFTSPSVVQKVERSFRKLRQDPKTYTMVHTGQALASIGVADPRVQTRFKDAKGNATNGNTEPVTLDGSVWDKVMAKVGSDYGWHIFAMALMDGFHSVTLFVDNQPDGRTLYWADQWRIDPGDDFFQLPGAISGFREYEKAGFEQFIETMTNRWWNEVHKKDSKCGKGAGKHWDSVCRYPATVMFWHLRKVVQK